jgi:archaellum component FlaF (FlaF/FlaG flagellin family)
MTHTVLCNSFVIVHAKLVLLCATYMAYLLSVNSVQRACNRMYMYVTDHRHIDVTKSPCIALHSLTNADQE